MDTRATSQPDPGRVLEAIVIGGHALAVLSRQTKVRRHVPYKQERLVRLVVQKGLARIDDFKQAFHREWTKVQQKRRKRSDHRKHQELFRNMADLAKRVNSALAAGFSSPGSRRAMLQLTSGRFVALTINHQAMAIGYVVGESLAEIEPFLPRVEDSEIPALPGPLPSPPTTDETGGSLPPENLPEPDEPIAAKHGASAAIDVTIDPVTGRWRFALDGQGLEVDPIHGYLKVGSQLLQVPELRGLKEPGDLVGLPFRRISSLIRT